MRRLGSFLAELKRRRVYQVAAVYLVVAVAALELADVLVPATTLPEWSEEFFVVLAIVCFPIVVVLAWIFDLTSDGIRRESSPESRTGARSESLADGAAPYTGVPDRVEPPPSIVDESASRAGSREARSEPGRTTIAVLPFTNLSGDPDAEPLAAGLHDDLLTELSRASALTVISRTSVLRYRDTTRSIHEIGRELGVGAVVEGGVQKAGDRIRLNIQLIDTRTDVHLWAERYDRELSADNIFELQSDLAARIMEALDARLTGPEAARTHLQPTADLEAYRHYSIARALFVERAEEPLRAAIEHFERAIQRDPAYALARAGLAHALVMLVDYRHTDSAETLERAEAEARRALDIDHEIAEGHSALGNLYSARRQCRKALEAHERAISLRAGYAGAHQWRSWVSLLIGDPRTAAEAGERACRLDPLDPEARGNLAMAHLGCGNAEEAIRTAEETLERHPGFDWARWVLGLALDTLGRADEASVELRRLTEPWASAWPDTVAGLDGVREDDADGARRALGRQLEARATFHTGILHAALGEPDEALAALGSALPLTWDEVLYLRYHRGEPVAGLRGDRRWPGLMRDLDRAWGV